MNILKKILRLFGFRINCHKEYWSQEDELDLRVMSLNSVPDDEIAANLGRTKRAIQQKRYVLGFSMFKKDEKNN